MNGRAWALPALSLLFAGLCVGLNSSYPNLDPLVLAGLVFVGTFLLLMAGSRVSRKL